MTAGFYHVDSAASPRRNGDTTGSIRRAAVAASLLALIVGGGCRRQSNRALDPTNELPFGHVDMPTDGQHVGSETSVAGWAMDDRGIREIRVYVDGHFVNVAQLAVDRPDVSKVFPQYARGSHQHGWGVSVQFQGADVHKIVVQAVDSDGATRDIGVLDVTSGG